MAVASWICSVLWRAPDWHAALEQLVHEVAAGETTSRLRDAVLELGEPFEYLVPDRRRAIAIYELGGDHYSARRLAVEIGWWSARARLTTALRAMDTSEQLAIEEAEAWWDAGQRDLCELSLSGIVPAKRGERADALARLLAGDDLDEAASSAAARAEATSGPAAAEAFVAAARFADAAGHRDEMQRYLEAAIGADPSHDVAASMFVRAAMHAPDSESIQRFLRTRLAELEPNDWFVALRVTAFALVDSPNHRGLGLRLLRHLLERAYQDPPPLIPGHLAIWSVLAEQAKIDRTRRDLLPLVVQGVERSTSPVDRVWLGALAAEISLRDEDDAVVAGRYAEIVAEHAPEHPIVRELVAAIASPRASTRSSTIPPVPAAAVTAARAIEATGWEDISLDDIISGAATEAVMPLAAAGAGDDPKTVDTQRSRSMRAHGGEPAGVTGRSAEPPIKPAPRHAPAASGPDEYPIRPTFTRATVVSALDDPPLVKSSASSPVPTRGAHPEPPIKPTFTRATAVSALDDPPLAPASTAPVVATRPVHPEPPIKPAPSTPAPVAARPVPVEPPIKASPPSPAPAPARAPEPQPPIKSPAPARITPPIKPPVRPPSSAATASLPRSPSSTPLPSLPRAPGGGLPSLPPLARGVLDALRTPDRPALPARAPDPPDAKERARRIAVSIDVRFHLANGTEGKGVSRDISTSGLFVLTPVNLAIGDELALVLMVPGKEAFLEEEFRARARVVRSEERGHGLQLIDASAELLAALAAL